jgi:hypothetical protein
MGTSMKGVGMEASVPIRPRKHLQPVFKKVKALARTRA